jgi:hypothetical protein
MNRRLLHCLAALLPGLGLVWLLIWLAGTVPARASFSKAAGSLMPDVSNVYCVNQSGSGCDTGCGGGCYASVQAAVDAALPGSEVRIAGGAYTDPSGTVAVITKELVLRGGYGPGLGNDDFDPDLHTTVLDAQWGGSVIRIIHAGEVLIQHLTLIHGDGTGNYFPALGCGGGIYVQDSFLRLSNSLVTQNVGSQIGGGAGGGLCARDSSTDIWNSRIISNTASVATTATIQASGGGVFIYSSSGRHKAWLRESQFLNNTGHVSDRGIGGGIYLRGLSGAEVLSNTISGNWATTSATYGGWGGGINITYSSDVYVADNRIENNATHPIPAYAGYGGGVFIYWSDVHLDRNTILGNSSSQGGGIFIRSEQPVTITNNLIAENLYGGVHVLEYDGPFTSRAVLVNNTIAANGPYGVLAQYFAELSLTNNLVAGHEFGLDHPQPYTGTVTADTNLFWNADDPFTGLNAIQQDPLLASNYRLRPGSPALDAGLTIPWLAVDLEGTPRPQESGYDLGAFEGVWWLRLFLPVIQH